MHPCKILNEAYALLIVQNTVKRWGGSAGPHTLAVWTNNSYRESVTFYVSYNLCVGMLLKWFVSETPYLIHDTAVAPHITGSGVLLVVEGLPWITQIIALNYLAFPRFLYLRSCPLYWYFSSMRNIVVFVHQISRHSKVTDLKTTLCLNFSCTSNGRQYTLQVLSSATSMFLAARSLCTNAFLAK